MMHIGAIYDTNGEEKFVLISGKIITGILTAAVMALDDFSLENQEAVVMKWIEDKGYHLGNIMNAFRLTLVGEGKGPHMFDISAVLGKEETLRRIRRAVEVLK